MHCEERCAGEQKMRKQIMAKNESIFQNQNVENLIFENSILNNHKLNEGNLN